MTGGCEECGSFVGRREYQGRVLCREHRHRADERYAAFLTAWYVFLALCAAWTVGSSRLVAVLWALPAQVLLVALHQWAHAATASLLGLRVVRVTLGTGRLLRPWTSGKVPVDLRLLPVGGHVDLVPRREPEARTSRLAWRTALLAGPLATLVVALVAQGDSALGAPLAALAWFALLVDAAGVVSPERSAGPLHSDLMLLTRRGVRAVPHQFADHPSVAYDDYLDDYDAVMRALAEGHPSKAAYSIVRLRALQPDEHTWEYAQKLVLVEERRWDQARETFRALRDGATPHDRAGVAAALAWIGGVTGVGLDEAEAEARVALAEHPDAAGVRVAAALVAARRGRLAEAEEHLAHAETVPTNDVGRADAAVVRAYVAALRGDDEEARRNVALARALDPKTPVDELVR